MPRSTPLRRTLPLLLWVLPALAFILPSLREGSPNVIKLFLVQGLPWLVWVCCTPFILAQARRFPLSAGHRWRDIAVHVFSGLAIGALFGLASALLVIWSSNRLAPPEITRILTSAITFFGPFGLVFYTATLCVGFALAFHRRLREREVAAVLLEARLVEAQLGALRMQLQPHFLFNTLNTVAMLVRDGEVQSAVRMLARLSELLRHMLDDGQAPEVPLRTELEYAQRYLEIEAFRFDDRLRVTIDVPEPLRDALVPTLLLQPLVENALRHGLARSASAGTLSIRATRDGDRLRLEVSNDGPRLPEAFALDAQAGIGLRNTMARLAHLYGDDARLMLDDAAPAGVRASVELPWHTAPRMMVA